MSVAVYDQDGVNGVGANDLSLWWCDFFCLLCLQPPHTRSDYDHNGSVTSDINLLTARYMSETSSETGPRCDGQPTTKPTLTATQGGLNLAWSDCVSGGGTNMTSFACASNTGSTPVVFSVVAPPDITGLTGFEAEAIVVGGDAGSPLPDWWRLDGGACRSGSFSISAPGSGACEDAFVGSGLYAARMLYPYNAPYGGRFRIVGYTPANLSSPAALTEGQEYELFRLTINNNKTTGTGACSGCDRPVEIAFRSVKLVQGGGCAEPAAGATIAATLPDVIVDFPATSNHVYWQSLFTGVGGVVAAELGLARSGANPEEGLVLEVTLPSSAFATLDVFDPSGRRVATRALQSLAPGRHRVALATPGEIRPGLYFVRLSQGGRQRRLKATVVE